MCIVSANRMAKSNAAESGALPAVAASPSITIELNGLSCYMC